MKPEAQRIAIARACGWINQGETKGVPALSHRWVRPGDSYVFTALPNYLNDLNAMHEAEKVLTESQKWFYLDLLVPADPLSIPYNEQWRFAHATAAQRADAFLRTINLWEKP